MKTRQAYIQICQTCLKGKFDKKKGLICSITEAHAAYKTDQCPDYLMEEKAVKRLAANERRKAEAKEDEKGIFSGKGGIIGGIIMLVLAAAFIMVAIFYYEPFCTLYGAILIIAGTISLQKGINKRTLASRRDRLNIIDDVK